MRTLSIVAALALAVVLGAVSLLRYVPVAAQTVSPCADEIADISGTLQVCTMLREDSVNRVLTESLQAVAYIQDPFTGPTAHVSDTVDGQAFIFDLNPNRPWFVSIQTWNLPPGMQLEGDLVLDDKWVDDAVTFQFVCVEPPCNRSAPTRTPSPTAGLQPSRTPTLTPTMTLTPTRTVTPTRTPTLTPTFTLTPEPSPTPTSTDTPTATLGATPSATDHPAPTATATPPATSTSTLPSTQAPTVSSTQTPTYPPTAVPTDVPPASATPSVEPSLTATLPPPTAVPTAAPTAEPSREIHLPIAFR